MISVNVPLSCASWLFSCVRPLSLCLLVEPHVPARGCDRSSSDRAPRRAWACGCAVRVALGDAQEDERLDTGVEDGSCECGTRGGTRTCYPVPYSWWRTCVPPSLHVATWSRCLWSALTTCKRSLAVRTLLPVQSFFDIFEAEPKECKRRERRTRLPWQPFHVADSSRHQSSRQRD